MGNPGGGGSPPRPPGRFPRIGGTVKPVTRTNVPVSPGTSAGTGVHVPAHVTVDRVALDRMLDGRKRGRPGEAFERPEGLELLGSEDLEPDAVARMSSQLIAEHLMILLSKKRARLERSEALAEVGDLLIEMGDASKVKKVLNQMPEAGRIVDIYPLEVTTYVLARSPELLPNVSFQPFVRNRDALESTVFDVEAPMEIRLPVAMRVRMFALEGGGSPGYCLSPGAPGTYHLEVADAGRFTLLLRGDVRKETLIDRFSVEVRDPPGSD